MTNHHPITPSPELVQEWATAHGTDYQDLATLCMCVATGAAQWGWDQRGTKIQAVTDQELEACCEWVSQWCGRWPDGTRPEDELRAARRPRPPSLKELACAALDAYIYGNPDHGDKQNTYNTIRRALEQLPE
jgi:hypothetical protein